MKTAVCNGCGRTFENEYAFCPWCGQEHKNMDHRDYMDVIFQRYATQRNELRREKINSVSRKISELEKDLNVLVLSAEMHK